MKKGMKDSVQKNKQSYATLGKRLHKYNARKRNFYVKHSNCPTRYDGNKIRFVCSLLSS
jgi:hypothetical protein